MTLEIALAFGILAAAFAMFVADKFPIEFTAFTIMAAILLLGPVLNVTPEEAISGFSNPATITVLAVLILSGGVQRTGVVNVISRRMIRFAGDEPLRQQLTVQAVVAPVSAFINNTAAVAILIPSVIKMAHDSGRSPSKLLIPLSYMSQLGGVVTLIGTSTNILASQLLSQNGFDGFGMFEFSHIGIATLLTGALYLILVGRRLLPDHKMGQVAGISYGVSEYLTEILIQENSPLAGQTLAESGLSDNFDVQVLEILREDVRLRYRLGTRTLRSGDILVIWANSENLLRLAEVEGFTIEAQSRLEGDLPARDQDQMRFLEVVVGPNSDLIGGTLASTNFRNRYGVTVIAVRKHGSLIRERLGRVRLGFGDTLLLQGEQTAFDQVRRERGFIVTEQSNLESFRTRKIPIALAIIAGVVGFAALGQPILVTAIVGCVLMVLTGCLRVDELHDSIRWDVILLLAGTIPLCIMRERTGAAELLANLAVRSADYVPAIGVLYVFYIVTMILTDLISNNATVVLLVPVGIPAAVTLGVDPTAIVLAIMFASSCSFATPVGYQTNAMVYGIGGYKFTDFFKVGGGLNILLALTTPLYIYLLWGI
ncbi:SLC13 family permease [soil metagenome]